MAAQQPLKSAIVSGYEKIVPLRLGCDVTDLREPSWAGDSAAFCIRFDL